MKGWQIHLRSSAGWSILYFNLKDITISKLIFISKMYSIHITQIVVLCSGLKNSIPSSNYFWLHFISDSLHTDNVL